MHIIQNWTPREKILVFIIFLLVVVLLAGWNPVQAAKYNETQYSTQQLYINAKNASLNGDYGLAVAFLYAYIQRNPQEYSSNLQYSAAIDGVYRDWIQSIKFDQSYRVVVESHLASCGHYPCGENEAGLEAIHAEIFPADKVMVCDKVNYMGKCSYLRIGEYTNWRNLGVGNDTISSVMLGDDVKVLLCVHNLGLLSDCIEFTGSDSNLSNNKLPGKSYSIDNNVSTARVTYKPGRGLP